MCMLWNTIDHFDETSSDETFLREKVFHSPGNLNSSHLQGKENSRKGCGLSNVM